MGFMLLVFTRCFVTFPIPGCFQINGTVSSLGLQVFMWKCSLLRQPRSFGGSVSRDSESSLSEFDVHLQCKYPALQRKSAAEIRWLLHFDGPD